MSTILQNSIWPNTEGNLGTIKVQIPDGVNTFWPEGDALVGNFVYKDGLISGFVDAEALIVNEGKASTIPYDYVNIHLASIQEGEMEVIGGERTKYFTVTYGTRNSGDTIVLGTKYLGCKTVSDVKAVETNYQTVDIVDGTWTESLANLENGSKMFSGCSDITTFTSDLSSLMEGSWMFEYCSNLTTFTADLSSLKGGPNMFQGCSNLTTFTSNLSSLINGDYMFMGCSVLNSFASNLSSLTKGHYMFYGCSNLTAFTTDLSSLTNGNFMFENCSNLTTFTADLSSITNGWCMFKSCSSLTTFSSDLRYLTDGRSMFKSCKLDTASIKNIAETINTVTDKPSIHIGIGSTTPSEEEHTHLTQIHNKGWNVYVNGSSDAYVPATVTLDETGETMSAPIPFWAKPEPATEETANYIDENGNFFNILGGQFIYVDDPETYGMFTCEEDAAANMRLTKIEKMI